MIISIHQPNYFPWLGYFYKIYKSDIFVMLDDVQFSNEGMHNYHYLKTPQGSFRLKIPVEYKTGNNINQVNVRDELDWRSKHLKTVESNYKKAPFFNLVYPDLEELIKNGSKNLTELNADILLFLCKKFNIETKFVKSSSLDIHSNREQKVIDICLALKGTIYYSGSGAKSYQNEENFLLNGLKLEYSSYKIMPYEQLWGEFVSNISIIDFCMNCGYDFQKVIDFQK